MYVEKFDGQHWEAVQGPNPNIARYLRYAASSRERGDVESALKHEKNAADIASGELSRNSRGFEREYYAPHVLENWLYDGRNYDLFAILANVRNGYGFAGAVTGDGFEFISGERGIPDDASLEVNEALDDADFHNHGYIYLYELLAFDWNQKTTHISVVNSEEYLQWKKDGKPHSYRAGVSGTNIIHLSNEEMESHLENPLSDANSYFTKISWHESYMDCVDEFYTKSIPQLQNLSEQVDGNDIRIVFAFDN